MALISKYSDIREDGEKILQTDFMLGLFIQSRHFFIYTRWRVVIRIGELVRATFNSITFAM